MASSARVAVAVAAGYVLAFYLGDSNDILRTSWVVLAIGGVHDATFRPNAIVARWVEAGKLREQAMASPEDGLSLFDRLRGDVADAPTMIAFSPSGSDEEFAIGAGRALSILTFQRAPDPPYYRSRGVGDRQGDLWFIYAGENTQFRASDSVPIDMARDALQEYLMFGDLPVAIGWDEV